MFREDRISLIEELETRKGGKLGYFSPRQQWRNGQRYGYGRWIGKVMGVRVCLEMMDNTLLKISCSSLDSHESLAYNLKELINELHLRFPSESTEPGIQYTISGRFCHSDKRVTSSVPVSKDVLLSVDLDMIAKSTWILTPTEYSLRLMMKDGADEMTLCACYLSQSDYRPELIKETGGDDLENAVRSRFRPSEQTWINFVNKFAPSEITEREEEYEVARKTGLFNGLINCSKLKKLFIRALQFVTRDITVDTESLANIPTALNTEELDFISSINFGMAEDAQDMDLNPSMYEGISDEIVEFDSNEGNVNLDDISREDLDRMSKLYANDERKDLAMKNIIGISPTNPLFDSLISYITREHPDFSLEEMVNPRELIPRNFRHPWSIVISMITGKNYEQFSEDANMERHYEERLDRISMSLASGTDRGSIDRMSVLEDIIANSSGIERQNALLLKIAEERYIERYNKGQYEFPNKWIQTLDIARMSHELYYEHNEDERKKAYHRLIGPEKYDVLIRSVRIELREMIMESDSYDKDEKMELLTKISNRKSKIIQLEMLAWKYKTNIIINFNEESITIVPMLPDTLVSSESAYEMFSKSFFVTPF